MVETPLSDKLDNFEEFTHNFEIMCGWNDKDWNDRPEDKEIYGRTVNGLRFWSKNAKPLMNDTTLLLSVFENSKLVIWNELKWISFMRSIGVINEFSFFFGIRNPAVIGIKFKSNEGRTEMENNLFRNDEGFIIDLNIFYKSGECNLRIHWLPKGYYEEEFKVILSKYIEILDYVREDIIVDERLSYPSKIVNVRGIVRVEDVNTIPHILKFKKIEILLVIQGREAMCLRCEELGHKAYECVNFHCKLCKSFHKKNVKCENNNGELLTYAQCLKGNKDESNKESLDEMLTSDSTMDNIDYGKESHNQLIKENKDEETITKIIEKKENSARSKDEDKMEVTLASNKRGHSDTFQEIPSRSTKFNTGSTMKTYSKHSQVAVQNTFDVLTERDHVSTT